jgi:hypothetical protein
LIQVANTLKARYFLMTRQYPQAYESALLGVKSNSNSLKYAAYSGYGTTNETVIYIISSYLAVDLVILLQIIFLFKIY